MSGTEQDRRPEAQLSARAAPRPAWTPDARTVYAIVAVAAILVRLMVLPQVLHALPFYRTTAEGYDQHTYDLWAQAVAGGDLLSRHVDGPFFMAPLCPYLLGGVYALAGKGSVVAGILLNALFGVCAALLAAAIARRLFGNWAGLAAGLLMGLNGSQISVEAMSLNDPLLAALCLAAIWFVVAGLRRLDGAQEAASSASASQHPNSQAPSSAPADAPRPAGRTPVWPWLLSGVFLGLACLGRASNLLVAAAMAALVGLPFLWRRDVRRVLACGLMAAGVAVVVALPVLRNGLMFGRWTIATSGPIVFYLGNAPGAPGILYHTHEFLAARERVARTPDPEAAWRRELAQALRQHPEALYDALVRKTLLMANSWDSPDNANYYFMRHEVSAMKWLTFGPLVLYVLGTIGLILTVRMRRTLMPLYVFALSFAASLIVTLVAGRFKLPFLGVLCVFGGAAVSVICAHVAARQWRVPVTALVIAACLIPIYWARAPIGFPLITVPYRADDFITHALALAGDGRSSEGLGMLEEGGAIFPHNGAFSRLLASADLKAGHPAKALERVERALADPERYESQPVLRSLMEERVQALVALDRQAAARRAAEELMSKFPDSKVGRDVLGK